MNFKKLCESFSLRKYASILGESGHKCNTQMDCLYLLCCTMRAYLSVCYLNGTNIKTYIRTTLGEKVVEIDCNLEPAVHLNIIESI